MFDLHRGGDDGVPVRHHRDRAGRFAGAVREEEAFWTSRDITGVPAMVFDQRYLLVGAQGAETYKRMLDKLIEERAAYIAALRRFLRSLDA